MNFDNTIIRCELYPDDISSVAKFVTLGNGRTPGMFKGAQAEFQFALFKTKPTATEEGTLYDIASFSGLPKLRIRTLTAAGSLLLDDTVSGCVVQKDATLDITSWRDGSKQHFRFYFPETATGIATGTQFIVIYGPDQDVFGTSSIEVIDPGTGAASSPVPGDPTYYTKVEEQGLLLDKLNKNLDVDQPIVFRALNPTTGKTARITFQPLFDENGPRLVPMVEYID